MLVWLSESHVDEADYLTFWSSFWSLLGTEDQASSTGKVLTMAIIPALLRVWIWRGKNVCVRVCVCVCVCVCEERMLGRETEGKPRIIKPSHCPWLMVMVNNWQKTVFLKTLWCHSEVDFWPFGYKMAFHPNRHFIHSSYKLMSNGQ